MSISPKQLVVLGDSGVYGWGDREGGGWCERLRKHWMNLPIAPVLYPLGIRGNGLEDIAKRWSNEWLCRGELKRKFPDGILVSIGLNDSANIGRQDGRPKLSAEAFRYGLMQLLGEMKTQTSVMVTGLTPVNEEFMPFAECLWYSNKAGEIYEAQIEEVCLERDIPFLPIHKEFLLQSNWINLLENDGIHLNSNGHAWYFKRINNWSAMLDWANLHTTSNFTPLV